MGPIAINGDPNIGVMGSELTAEVFAVEVSGAGGWEVFIFFAEEPPSSSLLSAPSAVMIFLPARMIEKIESVWSQN